MRFLSMAALLWIFCSFSSEAGAAYAQSGAPLGVNIEEGFESGAVPPSGWEQVVNNADYSWEATSSTAHSGAFSAQVQWDPDPFALQNEWLLSPAIVTSQLTTSFWSKSNVYWCRDVHNNCELFIWVVVGELGGSDDILVGKADDDWVDTDVWSLSTFDLTPFLPSGGVSVRVGYNYMAWDDRDGVALDDIQITGQSGPGDQIFSDGFESGDTTAWSSVVAP